METEKGENKALNQREGGRERGGEEKTEGKGRKKGGEGRRERGRGEGRKALNHCLTPVLFGASKRCGDETGTGLSTF